MTRDERIAKIQGSRWIRCPLADQIASKLEELLLLPRTHRMPNLLIVGETNNGKTALVRRFVRGHPPQESAGDVPSSIPVVAIEAPPVPDERRLYQAILREVFAPFRSSARAAHHRRDSACARGTALTAAGVSERHQTPGKRVAAAIVAVGTQDAFNAIQTDPQLANRFEPAVLQRWKMGEDYLRLLASLSGGTIGEISTLLCRAAIAAIENGTERITIASLDRCGYVAPSERRRLAIAAD